MSNLNGGSQAGNLRPNFSEKIGGNSPLGESGLFGADWGLSKVYRGFFGAFSGPIPPHLTTTIKSRKCPKKALFGPIGAFRAKPPFAKPPFGFPRISFAILIAERTAVRWRFFYRGEIAHLGAFKIARCLGERYPKNLLRLF